MATGREKKMRTHSWIVAVIDDLGLFASNEDLPKLATVLNEAKLRAIEELEEKTDDQAKMSAKSHLVDPTA